MKENFSAGGLRIRQRQTLTLHGITLFSASINMKCKGGDPMTFWQKALLIFFTALGVEVGGTLIGSLAAVCTGQPPGKTMAALAADLKIWAIVAAIGGTFTTIEILESGLLKGQVAAVLKQFLFILSAFGGANTGFWLVTGLAGGR